MSMINYKAKHFNYKTDNGIAVISIKGAKQKNPLTFDSYAELRDVFREMVYSDDIHAVILGSNKGNFCSGGSVFGLSLRSVGFFDKNCCRDNHGRE